MSEKARQEAEDRRVVAEELREEHEIRRRIGEGGPDQHVPGNVEEGRFEAEKGRVQAEIKRQNVRRFYAKIATTIALPIAFIALVPSLIGLYYLEKEIDDRTEANVALIDKNHALIRANAETRAALVRGFKRADISTCQKIEDLKAQNRQKAQENYDNRFQTLRLLNIEITPEIEQVTLNNLKLELKRNAPRTCAKLPPPG